MTSLGSRLLGLAAILLVALLPACTANDPQNTQDTSNAMSDTYKVQKTEDEWKAQLTDEQYRITREAGTERAFTGKYWDYKGKGSYHCVCCGNELFESDTKFKSGTGWPSFWKPAEDAAVRTETDSSFGMSRTEVVCADCGAHLGHVFDDGPEPTGLRYCINSASLLHEDDRETEPAE